MSSIALGILIVILLAVVFAPLIAPYSPLTQSATSAGPSLAHIFGQDSLGRDIFSRLLYGGRWSLAIGLGSTLLALVTGSIIGAVAATAHRAIGETIMRILDVIMAFPGIALAAVLLSVFGRSIPVLIISIGFLYMPMIARVVRANVLEQYGEDYVAAEKVIGARAPRIVIKHVIVNCAAPVLVFCTVMVADAIVFEASLSFIGAGVQPPNPSWGAVISDGKSMVLTGGWWATLFPGLVILLTVLALNILAEGLTDAMASPRGRKGAVRSNATAPIGAAVLDPNAADEAPAAVPVLIDAVSDTSLAPVEQEIPLSAHLARLATVERGRTDRLVYDGPDTPLLEVQNLSIRFPDRYGEIPIVDDVSFTVRPNETMALVGESGCGKSITSLAIMGLLPRNAEVSGRILFDGVDLLTMNQRDRNALRGHDMSMVYQDALSSLNPGMLIRSQFKQLTARGGTRSATELLEMVGLDPVRTLKSYPHELSGGQRQRVLIALALTRSPKLIVADEPTTALDVTVQAQVVDLLNDLRAQLGFAMVFVSHDLALVASLAHRVTVMYAGQIVESAETSDLLTSPQHEYTQGLLGSVLSIEDQAARLHQIPGNVPSPHDFTSGDRFAARSVRTGGDPTVRPRLVAVNGTDHFYAARAETRDVTDEHHEQEVAS